MSNLKNKTTTGLIWSFIERFSAQGVQFILGLVLARLLLPSDYGLIGMLTVFIAISQTFINSGFSTALIQKQDRDEYDFSTVFYFNIVIAAAFYLLLFLTAPLIAEFYNQPILIPLTRAIGLVIIINSFAVVQRAKFTIKIDFKTQTKASLSSVSIAGIIGIYLAYAGYGVWSLVAQTLIGAFINVLVLWVYSKWVPRKKFQFSRFKRLFSFGSKLLLSGLLDTIFTNLYLIIIGKVFSAVELGYYTRAKQFNDFPSSNITGILQRVTFPVLSEIQNDDKKLRVAYRKMIKLSALLVFPLMIGLASLAHPIIIFLLTDKWVEAAWMLQLLCFAGMLYPIHALNLNILNVKGRSDLFLRLEIIKKVIITLTIIISLPMGIKAIIIGQIITSFIALFINTYYTNRIINYSFWHQISDLSRVFVLSIIMGILVLFTISFIETNIFKLLIGTIEGLIFYLSIAWVFNIGEIKLLPSLIKQG